MPLKITIPWRILTKNNKLRRGRDGRVYLDPKYKAFERDCLTWLLQWGNIQFSDPISVNVTYYFDNKKSWPDEDNLSKTLGDILQKSGIIKNDRLIQWGMVRRLVDPPARAEIIIENIND